MPDARSWTQLSPGEVREITKTIGAPVQERPRSYMGSAPVLFFWGLAIALSPIAGLGPGNPQVSHFLLTGFLTLLFTTYFVPVQLDRTIMLIGGLWVADVFFVNVGNWLATGQRDSKFLLSIFYYTFNFGIMIGTAALAVAVPERFRTITRLGILAALAFESIALFAGPGGYRTAGTFENPNQLGYWALVLSACWLAMKAPGDHLELRDGLVLGVATLLCAQSGSRAAAVGVLFLIGVAILWYGIRPKVWPFAAVTAVALGIVAYATFDTWTASLAEQTVVDRFSEQKKHDSFAARGYDRIWLYPEYLLFGAGEGAFHRFPRSLGVGFEIHSSFATILFGYGIPGSLLFVTLLWHVLRPAGLHMIVLASSLGAYGLAHQGLRMTPLWVFLGIVLARRWSSWRYANG